MGYCDRYISTQGRNWSILRLSVLLELIAFISVVFSEAGQVEAVKLKPSSWPDQVLYYIEQNFCRPLTVSDCAACSSRPPAQRSTAISSSGGWWRQKNCSMKARVSRRFIRRRASTTTVILSALLKSWWAYRPASFIRKESGDDQPLDTGCEGKDLHASRKMARLISNEEVLSPTPRVLEHRLRGKGILRVQ